MKFREEENIDSSLRTVKWSRQEIYPSRQSPLSGGIPVVFSSLQSEVTRFKSTSGRKHRERFADRLSPTGELLRATLFTSPSAASDFPIASSTARRVYWKNQAGVTLGELEQAEAKAAAEDL